MSGYLGDPDAEAAHAMVLAENGIRASQSLIEGPIRSNCLDCDDLINPERVQFMRKIGMMCQYCTTCQPMHDKVHRFKMLDRIL